VTTGSWGSTRLPSGPWMSDVKLATMSRLPRPTRRRESLMTVALHVETIAPGRSQACRAGLRTDAEAAEDTGAPVSRYVDGENHGEFVLVDRAGNWLSPVRLVNSLPGSNRRYFITEAERVLPPRETVLPAVVPQPTVWYAAAHRAQVLTTQCLRLRVIRHEGRWSAYARVSPQHPGNFPQILRRDSLVLSAQGELR
jgi:hypothetical protein